MEFVELIKPIPFIPEIDFQILENPNWIAEPKYDGWRIEIISTTTDVFYYTRKGRRLIIDLKFKLPPNTVLDGELITIPYTSNYSVHSAIHKDQSRLLVVLFDILFFKGRDLRNLPLVKRKEILNLIEIEGTFTIIKPCKKDFNSFVELKEKGFEGIVFKNLSSTYSEGSWIKLKSEEDFLKALEVKKKWKINRS